MKNLTLKIKKLGISIYVRSFYKYKSFYIIPGLTAEYLKLATKTDIDFEIKILCFGVGIKFFKNHY